MSSKQELKRAENGSGQKRVSGSGRITKIMTKTNIKRLKTMFEHRDGVSTRHAARKFKCSQHYIVKELAKKTLIKCRKKQKIPLRNEDQRERIAKCCDRLYRKLKDKSVILDDESYFTFTHCTINGNKNFYSSDVTLTPADVKYCKKGKFEEKNLCLARVLSGRHVEALLRP